MRVRSAFLICGLAVAGQLVSTPATAQPLDKGHFRDVFTDVDDDFCGTGQRIDIAGNVLVNEWQAPHKGDFKTTASGKITLTNPLTGDTAVSRFAGPTWVVNISGDPEGDHVQQVTVAGLPELWKLAHGRVLIRDAGYVVLLQTIEDDEVVDNEVLINKGPHPDLDSDFDLFCEVMPAALGIEG